MEHLDTMDHLRDSVRLRGYGQRDPLVEYKKEGYQLFKDLVAQIDHQVIHSIYKVGVHMHEEAEKQVNQLPQIDVSPQAEKLGRNDKCYCGSDKKYKKCHGKNA
jgi:preprotein translocase subunit SecA